VAATARDSFLERVREAAAARYEIIRELGHGGFATVFLAHEKALSRDVALKVLHMSLMHDADLVERFATEARTLASLRHRHVLRIHAVEDFAFAHCFVMEFVAGQTLDSVLREHARLPVAAVQSIAYQASEALDYAHRRGVIHRDVKPANVMLDEFGDVIVMDFGIAKIVAGTGTQQSVMMGTPQYMSPEQFRGDDIGPASDQYSLGVMLYALLCGRAPFQHLNLVSQMNAVRSDEPEPVTSYRPDCPPHISAAIGRMLAKAPAARFASCSEAAEAIGGTALPAGHEVSRYLADLASRREPKSVPTGALSLSHGGVVSLRGAELSQSRIIIEPIGRPLELGEGLELRARSVDDLGTPVPGFEPSWSVEGDAISLSGHGHIVAVKPGQAVIKVASGNSLPEQIVVTVVPPAVDSVLIHAQSQRLVVGEAVTLSATVLDVRGRELESRPVVWSSDAPEVATVEREGGIRARSAGVVTIAATCEGKRSTIELTVAAAPVAEVRLRAEQRTLKAGTTMPLAVEVSDRLGLAVYDEHVLFSSSEPGVLAVDEHGVVSAIAEGRADITAWCGETSGTISITVLPDVVASLEIQATKSRVATGASVQLFAVAKGSSGLVVGDRQVVWSTDRPAVAAVTAQGVVTGKSAGSVTITATCEGRRSSVALEIIEPRAIPAERPRRVRTGVLVGGVVAIAAAVILVASSGDDTPPAEESGIVAAVPTGPEVASVTFEPEAPTVRLGGRIGLRAVALDDNGVRVDAPIQWSTSDTSMVTLIGDSIAEFSQIGNVTITAAASGRSASAMLTVVDSAQRAPPTTARVVVRADVTRLYPGDSVPVRVSALDSDGALLDGRPATLTSSNDDVVMIRGRTILVARATGSALVRGTVDGISGEVEITVVPVPISEVRVAAITDTLRIDETIRLPLTVIDARGNQSTVGGTWTVDNTERAVVSGDGSVTGLSAGAIRVTAEVDGVRGSVSLLVVENAGAGPPDVEGAPPASPFDRARVVFAGGARSCLGTDNEVLCWGLDRADAEVVPSELTDVSVGTAHACGMTAGGSVVCWGENRDGQLGTGPGPARPTPGQPVSIPGGESVTQVSAGGDHACALTTSGSALCWGKNSFGQNGDGGTRNNAVPVAVRASVRFRAIAAGGAHTCALGTDGAVYCWGDNFSGAVGTTRFEAEPLPVNVDEGRYAFEKIYAGGKSTCALTAQGEAYCWGENRYGQVGVGNRTDRVGLQRPVQRDVRFSALALGERHVCGLAAGGELYCWGDNAFGQLGNGASADQRGLMVPTEAQTSARFSSIAAGQSHSCGVSEGGGVYCWGDNSRRQLAPLTDPRVLLPTRLGG
jgi:serine/threonine protein kinase/uncharacterized protein YjdB